ncbi:hypothetical protein Q1695_006298 [Nippostrongylus brasiliensis]|nr:hypothetical protein Q1695_006298 [Nippostrongylus brasiliensis]
MRRSLFFLTLLLLVQVSQQQEGSSSTITTVASTQSQPTQSTTTAAKATTTSGGAGISTSKQSTVSTTTALTGTVSSTTTMTTTPLKLSTVNVGNGVTNIDGKLLLQNSLALANQVQRLINEINTLEDSVNATNSPYFDQMIQMQTNATQMNSTLTALLASLNDQMDRANNLTATMDNYTRIYSCFASTKCVTEAPTTVSTTAPSTTTTPKPSPCPTIAPTTVTKDPQSIQIPSSTNIQKCSAVFSTSAGYQIVLDVNVTISGSGAILSVNNAHTGDLLTSFNETTNNAVVNTTVSAIQLNYAADWLSSIEFSINVSSQKMNPCETVNCNNGTCQVNPATGQPLCTCDACASGTYCDTETDPCSTAAATRRCRINQSVGNGTCVADLSIPNVCGYSCICTYPIQDVPNQCAASDTTLFLTALQPFVSSPLSSLQKLWSNLW